MAKLIIDGVEYDARPGQNCLEVALDNQLDLPYFCYHPALGSVGSCRLCAVKVFKDERDTTGRIAISCMEPVTDGKRISIKDPEAEAIRKWIIELLMANHPHDCPICDEGGECHLQDMTVMTGHRKRRYRSKKRTFDNQNLGPLINHEMNRCIHCYRCVRYYQDYAGDHDLIVMNSRNRVYFGRREEGVLESPFAGNLIDVCPTGVFTDKTLKKHFTRNWDQESAPSICTQCGMGCNIIPGARYGEIRRILPRYNEEVNGYFICDRGRFGYEFNNADTRLRQAQIQQNGSRQAADHEQAWALIQDFVVRGQHVAGIGSPRASLETNFALQQLVGADNFSNGLSTHDHELTECALDVYQSSGIKTPTLLDIEKSDAILLLGCDVTNELPRSDLGIRQAVRHGAKLWISSSRGTRLDEIATARDTLSPAEMQKTADEIITGLKAKKSKGDSWAALVTAGLMDAKRPLIIVGWYHGSPELIRAAGAIVQALSDQCDAHFLVTFPEANSVGVGLLGGSSVEEMLQRAEAGEIDRLIVAENNLIERVVHGRQIQDALKKLDRLLILDHTESVTTAVAHDIIPVTTPSETNGSWINAEGRAARAYQAYQPEPWVPQSWEVLRDMPDKNGQTRSDQWPTPEHVLMDLAEQNAIFRPATETAPPPGYRLNGQKIPRMSERFSGRQAMPSIHNVRTHIQAPSDNETPFAFSMEGTPQEPPSSLIPRFWAPNWNSQEAIHKFQIEIGHGLHSGAPGKRLIESDSAKATSDRPSQEKQKKPSPKKGQLLLVPTAEIFGTESSSRRADAIKELIPRAYLELHPSTAKELNLIEATLQTLQWDEQTVELEVRISERVAPGIGLIPARFPETRHIHRPVVATVKGTNS